MYRLKITIGERIGRWVVLENLGSVTIKGITSPGVLLKCDCGATKEMIYNSFKRGQSTSCGCFRRENAAFLVNNREHKHNLSKHPLYKIWRSMKARCYNPNERQYKDYGGRGIVLCDEWVSDFKAFYDWCNINGYEKGLQIDREKNDDIYKPDNCRFVKPAQNMRNTRRNVNIEYRGLTKCITDWAKDLNMSVAGLQRRIDSWDIESAFTRKLQIKRKKIL